MDEQSQQQSAASFADSVERLDQRGWNEQQYLAQYDVSEFDRPSVTADMLIFTILDEQQNNYRKLPEKSLHLMMVQRGEHPYLGWWALPGGFVGINESLDEAAARELRSETGLDGIYMEQLYTWGAVERDPRTRVISTAYMALADSTSQQIKAGDDARDARWFKLRYRVLEEKKVHLEAGCRLERDMQVELEHHNLRLTGTVRVTRTYHGTLTGEHWQVLSSDGIAFDHVQMIAYGIERLRSKIEYTDIAFNLMPPLFTLSALQQVYEIVLGKELLAPAFRRKMAARVIATNEYTKDAGHRPSQLYRYRPEWED
ncbi:NUDIX hydrolase [Paenibacillus campi]|uniref:NUDIX hydrolase n=1 Tax=Paenibacillus campi TaxID=3106031 RepID=UPI002AFEABA4|nr:NUDIX domain-containing protein [Paenibacillus sp. SGZ-1014]